MWSNQSNGGANLTKGEAWIFSAKRNYMNIYLTGPEFSITAALINQGNAIIYAAGFCETIPVI